jgi:hypothetical protein
VLNLNEDTANVFRVGSKLLASYQADAAWDPSGATNFAIGFVYMAVHLKELARGG